MSNVPINGKAKRQIHNMTFACNGTEQRLFDCRKSTKSLPLSSINVYAVDVQCGKAIEVKNDTSCSCASFHNQSAIAGIFTTFVLLIIVSAILVTILM